MGLFDALFGKRELSGPAPDRLFAITTAAISLEHDAGVRSLGRAAVVFQPLSSGDFAAIAAEMEEVVRATGEETGTTLETRDDDVGYRWMVLVDDDIDDLAVGLNAIGEALRGGGYGERVLCAVFAFADADGAPVYFIYNYKRGTFYPFVPRQGADQERDNERELRLRAQAPGDLPIEPELQRWFPLWGAPI